MIVWNKLQIYLVRTVEFWYLIILLLLHLLIASVVSYLQLHRSEIIAVHRNVCQGNWNPSGL